MWKGGSERSAEHGNKKARTSQRSAVRLPWILIGKGCPSLRSCHRVVPWPYCWVWAALPFSNNGSLRLQ